MSPTDVRSCYDILHEDPASLPPVIVAGMVAPPSEPRAAPPPSLLSLILFRNLPSPSCLPSSLRLLIFPWPTRPGRSDELQIEVRATQHLHTVVLNAASLARDTITYSYYVYYVLLSLYLDTSLFLLLVGPAIGVIKAQGATRLFCFCASTE